MLILPGLDSVAGKFWARFVKAIIRKIFYLISSTAYNLHFLNLGEKRQIFSPFPIFNEKIKCLTAYQPYEGKVKSKKVKELPHKFRGLHPFIVHAYMRALKRSAVTYHARKSKSG